MKSLYGKNLIMLIVLMISGCFAFAVNAAFNEQINFQGKLTDSSDVNVIDGDYNFEFKLWSHESTTTESYLEWTETCTTTKVAVASGLFSHLLGSVNALPDDIFNQTLWLEVSVGGTTTEPVWETLAPRKKLGAVPAAFEAKRLDGYASSSFAILSENETITGAWTFSDIISASASSSSAILTLDQTGDGNLVDFKIDGTSKFVIDNSGNVATGTWQATPIALTYGGTGANSSSTARTNLGLEIGTDVQEYNTDLSAIAAGTWTGAESIDTLGTIATGTWNGSVILPNFGGTGTGTVFTQGSIVFAGASGVYTQNNASFFWDNSNVRLGIGTAVPGQRLTVAASLSSSLNSGYFSTGNILLSSLEGGMYFGRVGVRENIFGLSGYGDTWTAEAVSSTWNSVAMSSDGRIQTAVTQGGLIYNSSDYGNSWTQTYTIAPESLVSVSMSSDGKIQAAVSTGSRIYTSIDYGINWSSQDDNRYWKSVAMSADGKIMTAVDTGEIAGGYVYKSTDYGDNWATTSIIAVWTSAAMSSDGKIQAAAVAGGEVYISTDYGDNWASTSASHAWTAVSMSADGRIITATVNDGKIYVSYDYGSTWTEQAEVQTWTSVAMSSEGKIQAATDDGGQIYISTDYGTSTWTAKGSNKSWKSVAMSSDGKIMTAVANDDYIYVSHSSSYLPDGKLGIGTSTPSSVLDVYATTSSTILTVKQDGSGSLVDFRNATGTVLTINNAGNTLLTGNLLPSATETYSLGSLDYLWANLYTATSNLGIVASGTWQGTAITDAYIADAITISGGNIGSNNASGTWTTTGTLTIGDGGDRIDISSDTWDVTNGVFTGVAGITSSGNITLSGTSANIILGSNYLSGDGGDEGVSVNAAGTVLIGGGTGKLTVGTVDPVYDIQGLKHATYMSGMLGVKEEATGLVQLADGEYVIDFNDLEQSSDLWVFYRITDFGQNWSKLTVLLSAEGPGAAWYQKDPQNNKLYIYSQTAESVSFRFTAPRFDWQKWLNLSEDGEVAGLLVDEIVNDQYSQGTSTEDQIPEEVNILSEFAQKVKEALASLGLFIENGIANIQEVVTEKLTARKARLDKIEMVDQSTGEIYCTWIKDGEWTKEKGECDIATVSEPQSPAVPDETPSQESSSTEETVVEEVPQEESLSEEETVAEETPQEEPPLEEETIIEETPQEEPPSEEETLPES